MKMYVEQHRTTSFDLDPERDLEPDHLEQYHYFVDRHELTRARAILEAAAEEILLGRGSDVEWDDDWLDVRMDLTVALA